MVTEAGPPEKDKYAGRVPAGQRGSLPGLPARIAEVSGIPG
jgi:hypothetical protein